MSSRILTAVGSTTLLSSLLVLVAPAPATAQSGFAVSVGVGSLWDGVGLGLAYSQSSYGSAFELGFENRWDDRYVAAAYSSRDSYAVDDYYDDGYYDDDYYEDDYYYDDDYRRSSRDYHRWGAFSTCWDGYDPWYGPRQYWNPYGCWGTGFGFSVGYIDPWAFSPFRWRRHVRRSIYYAWAPSWYYRPYYSSFGFRVGRFAFGFGGGYGYGYNDHYGYNPYGYGGYGYTTAYLGYNSGYRGYAYNYSVPRYRTYASNGYGYRGRSALRTAYKESPRDGFLRGSVAGANRRTTVLGSSSAASNRAPAVANRRSTSRPSTTS